MTACADCLQAASRPHWGGYCNRCAGCCARLIRSARPLKHLQDGHLAAIERRRPATPERAAVLAALRELDAVLAGFGELDALLARERVRVETGAGS